MQYRLKSGREHSLRGPNRELVAVVPGQIIDCEPEQFGGAIDKFELVAPDPVSDPPAPPKPTVSEYSVKAVEGGYLIINAASGEALNDDPVTAEEAADLAGIPLAQIPPPLQERPTAPVVDETKPTVSETTDASPGRSASNEA
jgi:hypothetical protein